MRARDGRLRRRLEILFDQLPHEGRCHSPDPRYRIGQPRLLSAGIDLDLVYAAHLDSQPPALVLGDDADHRRPALGRPVPNWPIAWFVARDPVVPVEDAAADDDPPPPLARDRHADIIADLFTRRR